MPITDPEKLEEARASMAAARAARSQKNVPDDVKKRLKTVGRLLVLQFKDAGVPLSDGKALGAGSDSYFINKLYKGRLTLADLIMLYDYVPFSLDALLKAVRMKKQYVKADEFFPVNIEAHFTSAEGENPFANVFTEVD